MTTLRLKYDLQKYDSGMNGDDSEKLIEGLHSFSEVGRRQGSTDQKRLDPDRAIRTGPGPEKITNSRTITDRTVRGTLVVGLTSITLLV